MTGIQFQRVLEHRQAGCRRSLLSKRDEYAPGRDVFSAFKRTGSMNCCTPEESLKGMVSKTWISLLNMIEELDDLGRPLRPIEVWEEKITDIINYLHLLEGLVVERLGSQI